MPRTYSAHARTNLNATCADEPLLTLLEIRHPALAIPVRVVNDTQDITVEGNLFQACPFTCSLPDDVEGQTPKAKLSIDNIGRELTQWLEASHGGQGATCRIMQVLRSTPEVIDYELTMDLTGLAIDQYTVTGELGFVDTLNQPAVVIRYDPRTAPGVF